MQDASSKQQTKQKYKPSHQQTGLSPHSALPIRGKTNKNSTQISPYAKLTQTTGPIFEGRNQKEERINLEVWEEETSNTVSLKQNNEKAEKYCTNEGTD